jgi:hypothetical protein
MRVIRIIIEIDDDGDSDSTAPDIVAMAYDKGYDAGVENASKAQPPAGDTNWNSGAGGAGVGAPTQQFKAPEGPGIPRPYGPSKANDGTGYAQAYNPDV